MASGIALIDKPGGMSSHQVVAAARRALGTRKVGHAGTLDPMATGLLVLGVDSATRLLHYLVGADKEYLATIRLGRSSNTDDAEGELSEPANPGALTALSDSDIDEAIAALSGAIEQVPSTISAIKVNGKRAYALARAGESVALTARPVTVYRFDRLAVRREPQAIKLDVRVECSSGTYIRALARDLGERLGVGGHLSALRRSRVGDFSVNEACSLEAFGTAPILLSPAVAAARVLPSIQLSDAEAIELGHGRRIARRDDAPAVEAAAIEPTGRLVAIVRQVGESWQVATGFPEDKR